MSPSQRKPASKAHDSEFLLLVRRKLARVADARKAPMMQAYMKSAMPYHGVQTVLMRQTCEKLFANLNLSTRDLWQRTVLDLWRGAKYREERYAAIALSGIRRAAEFQTLAAMPLYKEMIVTGAWWDYVDEIAANRVGPILRGDPAPMKKKMLAWSKCENMWKRRTSILCQLRFKQDTDLDLLYACIEPSLDSKEFFLRKAIGWALRQYAWTDAAEIRRYVRKQKVRLSNLSQREALKNLGK
ncbi:MAG TPA: DNA alkylation repair protein [Verrucomicrobiae bacterium]|nr:DNA alkylation repair protein [Verrucomicrobiae bacterium]